MNALSRRSVLLGGGALVVGFAIAPKLAFAQQRQEPQNAGQEARKPSPLPGSLKNSPDLDSWIRIGADGKVTVFTGKAELGQGIKTALIQIAAEQLSVDPAAITLITADTGQTANEGFTAGSHSMQDSGTAILNAAAQVREILIGLATTRLGVPADQLRADNGAVMSASGQRVGYGELVAHADLHRPAGPQSKLVDAAAHKVMGQPMPRVDIPAKVTGGVAYVHDLRLDGMVHGRVIRPPSYGAQLTEVDASQVERMPGVLKVVRDGSFLAVIAEREFQAIKAMRALAKAVKWSNGTPLPDPAGIYELLQKAPAQDSTIRDTHDAPAASAKTVEAVYHRPYQMHASIGPSCAVALAENDRLTVWSHAQGMFPLRNAVAELVHLPESNVRCIHMEGSGCYGHNGADDAGGDAALLARALPGRPVRVQWMREQEHTWEPYGPAMSSRAKAALDAEGTIVDFQYEVWSNTHSMRPGPAGNLLAGQHVAEAFKPAPPRPLPQPEGGGDRNAIPLYRLPNARVVSHFIPAMPLRVSAMRGLGAYHNIFAIESFMDELASAAGLDAVAFRLKHLDDPRAQDVVMRAADTFGWTGAAGQGFAFARYKNLGAYCAIALALEVERETGRLKVGRIVAAVDSGEAVNPDGIRNQIEGGIVQSLSWTMYEQVRWTERRIASADWSGYPILRFRSVPASVEVQVIDRPGQPFLGTGEAAQGPASAALANALARTAKVRLRDLPLTQEKVKAAIGV